MPKYVTLEWDEYQQLLKDAETSRDAKLRVLDVLAEPIPFDTLGVGSGSFDDPMTNTLKTAIRMVHRITTERVMSKL